MRWDVKYMFKKRVILRRAGNSSCSLGPLNKGPADNCYGLQGRSYWRVETPRRDRLRECVKARIQHSTCSELAASRFFFSCESEVLVWTKVHRTNVDTVLRQQTEQFCVTTRDCEVNSEVSVPYGDDAKEAKRASIPAQLTIPCADARGGPGGGPYRPLIMVARLPGGTPPGGENFAPRARARGARARASRRVRACATRANAFNERMKRA